MAVLLLSMFCGSSLRVGLQFATVVFSDQTHFLNKCFRRKISKCRFTSNVVADTLSYVVSNKWDFGIFSNGKR